MKVYYVDYVRNECVRHCVACDASLDPTNNQDDYNYVVGLVEMGYLDEYEDFSGDYINRASISVQDCLDDDDPEILIDREKVRSYPQYLCGVDTNEKIRQHN